MDLVVGTLLAWPLREPGQRTAHDRHPGLKPPTRAPLTATEYALRPAQIERIIGISDDGSLLATIDVLKPSAWYRFRHRSDVEGDLASGAAHVDATDPYLYLRRPNARFASKHAVVRETNAEIIAGIVQVSVGDREQDRGFELFAPHTLGPLVTSTVDRLNQGKCPQDPKTHKKHIYRLLAQWWQAGMVPAALYPRFGRCGGRDQPRREPVRPDPLHNIEGSSKRGRPSARMRSGRTERTGMNVDAAVKETFRRGTQLFLEQRPKLKIPDAFEFIEGRFYSCGRQMLNGHPAPLLLPEDQRPTVRQFRYWLATQYDPLRFAEKREGAHTYNLHHRAMTEGALRSDKIPGPGHEFQLDATLADVYLVSSLHRGRIIGRPVIYLIVDVWSRLIVGMSVALEGPSWVGAMLALDNMVTDKRAFCQEYGYDIPPNWWPSHHFPKTLKSDRGEMLSPLADPLARAYNVTVANTAPYRPDWKPYVERDFNLLHEEYIDKWIPGALDDARPRGGRDTRLDACLTLPEFRKYLIDCIVEYNTTYEVPHAMRSRSMIEDEVRSSPAELWAWGIANRTALLRTASRDLVRATLLPQERAHLSNEGIRFRGLHYTCPAAIEGGWFQLAALGRPRDLDIVYDPRTTDEIYLVFDDGQQPLKCTLLERDALYRGCDWYDVEDYRYDRNSQRQERHGEAVATRLGHLAYRNELIAKAKAAAREQRGTMSNAQRIAGVREHRGNERALERSQNHWSLGANSGPSGGVSPPQVPADTAYEEDTVAMLRMARDSTN